MSFTPSFDDSYEAEVITDKSDAISTQKYYDQWSIKVKSLENIILR